MCSRIFEHCNTTANRICVQKGSKNNCNSSFNTKLQQTNKRTKNKKKECKQINKQKFEIIMNGIILQDLFRVIHVRNIWRLCGNVIVHRHRDTPYSPKRFAQVNHSFWHCNASRLSLMAITFVTCIVQSHLLSIC